MKVILRRAQLYEDTDRPHEALKDFERVLELDPKHIESIVAVRVSLGKISITDILQQLNLTCSCSHRINFVNINFLFSDYQTKSKKKMKS